MPPPNASGRPPAEAPTQATSPDHQSSTTVEPTAEARQSVAAARHCRICDRPVDPSTAPFGPTTHVACLGAVA